MPDKTIFTFLLATLIILIFLLALKIKLQPSVEEIFLLGGLDESSSQLSINEQKQLLIDGSDNLFNVKGWRYTEGTEISSAITSSKKEMYVVLFSAGCSDSEMIAQTLTSKGYNLNKMFIVEPYTESNNVLLSITNAVDLGVPQENILVGNTIATGYGSFADSTPTPNCSPSHWCSLTEVGKMILN